MSITARKATPSTSPLQDNVSKSNEPLQERLLTAWLSVSAMLKSSRMTKGLTYNEAVVMKLVFDRYKQDGVGKTAIQSVLKCTNMLKSQVNRTVNALCAQGYLRKERDVEDGRSLFVRLVPEHLPDFLAVHRRSLDIAQHVIDVIGEADAASFARICEKLAAAGMPLPPKREKES